MTEYPAPKTPAEFLVRAGQIRDYFTNHAKHEPLFAPERDVAIKIVEVMSGGDPARATEVQDLLESLQGTKHYDGSGWLDFRMTVGAWLGLIKGEGPAP